MKTKTRQPEAHAATVDLQPGLMLSVRDGGTVASVKLGRIEAQILADGLRAQAARRVLRVEAQSTREVANHD